MNHTNICLRLVIPAICGLTFSAAATTWSAEPLENAHAHNDYWHKRPLVDALDSGFASVEADVFLVDGQLLVGHERSELKPDRTLESLYLKPLASRVRENGGRVDRNGHRFFLFVDIKSDAEPTWRQLQPLFAKYADVLATTDPSGHHDAAITVVLSGNRPIEALSNLSTRHAALDGRLTDLERNPPADVFPVISDNWAAHFSWRGNGPMPNSERDKLREIVRRAHQQQRVLRFWGTPEEEAVWQELRSAGVDLIGTDHLDRLANFLRSKT